jgi:hypothetical protein
VERRVLRDARIWRQMLLRQLSACLGVLCLLAQTSVTAHSLLVAHTRCAEHGEWIHAEREHAHERVSLASTGSDAPALQASDVADVHGHDHCVLWSDRNEPVLVPTAALQLRHFAETPALLAFSSGNQNTPEDVCSFAPKTSPPVSGRSS